ncbi:MAG: SCO family protein [Acidiferrobacterales bacterium]
MSENVTSPSPRNSVGANRFKLLLVAALFFLPMISATLLYYGGWRPHTQVNHGDLVQPARPIQDVILQTLGGNALHFSDLHGKWLMVYFGSSSCETACVHNLYKMRQVQIAQGKDADRILRVFVVTDTLALNRLRTTLEDYPGMKVITGPAGAITSLAKQFELPVGSPLDAINRVYIVDPIGNLMMSYPPDADPSGMRKDLVRLLKVSQVG